MQYKEFESNIESFSKILDILNVMKRVYKFECVSISERFILKERKNNLLEIISNIGVKYELRITEVVSIWSEKNEKE